MSAIVINSIRSLIDHHYQLRAWCNACRHNAVLDLERLGQQLGFDPSTLHVELVPKLKCSRCESGGLKAIGLTLSYDGPRIEPRIDPFAPGLALAFPRPREAFCEEDLADILAVDRDGRQRAAMPVLQASILRISRLISSASDPEADARRPRRKRPLCAA